MFDCVASGSAHGFGKPSECDERILAHQRGGQRTFGSTIAGQRDFACACAYAKASGTQAIAQVFDAHDGVA